jgi:hypothetical protein
MATVSYAGAPDAPDPASIYAGTQLLLIRTDGTRYPTGDPWRCLTCGMPAANNAGAPITFGAPQAFRDGKRILTIDGAVLDCAPHLLTDPACTAGVLRAYAVHWDGGNFNGLKLDPDGVHVGWNHIIVGPTSAATNPQQATDLDEFAYFGRLTFNPAVKRYDVIKVTGLFNSDPAKSGLFIGVDPKHPTQLLYKEQAGAGEFKNFSGDGRSLIGIGSSWSDNIDHVETDLATGRTHNLTLGAGYSDPVTASHDDNWAVSMRDSRDRTDFIAGMPGIPPLTDQLPSGAAAVAQYRNGNRRFFVPILMDRYGDRGSYRGQALNACPHPADATKPGSLCDPNWAAMFDSYWAPDDTAIVYWQTLAASPDCGTPTTSACEASTEQGGRTTRLMLARLTSRRPNRLPLPAISPVSDNVPWGTPYKAGDPWPTRAHLPGGSYTLKGAKTGYAAVQLLESPDKTALISISVSYTNFSDDGLSFINGSESVLNTGGKIGLITFHEDLTMTGQHTGTKTTSEPSGYSVSPADAIANRYTPVGTMTTTIDGKTYDQPPPLG